MEPQFSAHQIRVEQVINRAYDSAAPHQKEKRLPEMSAEKRATAQSEPIRGMSPAPESTP